MVSDWSETDRWSERDETDGYWFQTGVKPIASWSERDETDRYWFQTGVKPIGIGFTLERTR